MSDKDFEVLQTALSPEVSESREQVFYNRIFLFYYYFFYCLFFILSFFNYDTSVKITEELHLH